MAKRELWELQSMQAAPLDVKLMLTKRRVQDWINEFGKDGVYISFSGGKDSTVLMDIIRNKMGYDIQAVYVDTGLEYPEIREFVKTFDNVLWLKPEMNFKQVIEKYGYPFFSKEISQTIYEARSIIDKGKDFTKFYRYEQLEGIAIDPKTGNPSAYNKSKYKFLLDSPYRISHMCCKIMKKNPTIKFAKETGKVPILGQMAAESRLREQHWLLHGCNGFDMKQPKSNPMAFWTEQDVLQYIKKNNIKICSVYGDIVEDVSGTDEVEGQMTISDLQGFENVKDFDAQSMPLKTTGCKRTGCMFCGFGCHLEKGEGRFVRMKETHPKQYEWIMKPWSDGGLNYKEVIDWMNEHGNFDIKY